MADFGPAVFKLNSKLQPSLLTVPNPNDPSLVYQFSYHKRLQGGLVQRYRCVKCKAAKPFAKLEASVKVEEIENQPRIITDPSEGHDDMCESLTKEEVLAQQIQRELYVSAKESGRRTNQAHSEAMANLGQIARQENVNYDTLVRYTKSEAEISRQLRRHRQSGNPPIPDPFNLPDCYLTTWRGRLDDNKGASGYEGERWVLYQHGEPGHQQVCFMSDAEIKAFVSAEKGFGDGTFSRSPKEFGTKSQYNLMGGASTKFRKQLQRGEEYAALQLCERHPDLRKSLDPNSSYGENYGHNTPLHYSAKHSMKALIRVFICDLSGNPNKKNGDEATAVHLVCQGGTRMSRHLDGKIRSECLAILLAWEGPSMLGSEPEKADLNALDAKNNTALHYAAASGMKKCVELLVCRGASLTIENEAKETACDCAERCGFHDIAEYLETKMTECHDEINEEDLFPVSERFSGLREHDLIEAKDLLLVETSDMLQVPLFTAEALLRNHEWSREALWISWNRDPVVCCEKAGVQAPLSAIECRSQLANVHSPTEQPHSSSSGISSPINNEQNLLCGICTDDYDIDEIVMNTECQHSFCTPCWKQYVTVKIQGGDPYSISCPAFECTKLVPLDLIERVVSPSMARKYLTFDIKAFVDSNPCIKWCPFPGCANAVRLPIQDEEPPMYLRAFPKLQPPPPTSRTVYCPHGHGFCWDCVLEGHEPTSCDKWKDWHEKIALIRPEELKDTGSGNESAANCLWLVTHSKPCPKCKSPIQKNEGCNHMKCSKCKHDFCWVCLGQWKKHGTETGGYFRCNRYDETRKMEEKTEQAISEAKEQSKKAQELNRFVHYYSRYKNHLNSFEMEKSLRGRVDSKVENLTKLAQTESSEDPDQADFSFVPDAVEELLRSRKVLSSSYAYGYFLKDCGYNKTIFEYLQNELEVSVETLSGLVGRSYLRGSRKRIAQTTQLVASRRQRFLQCISRGLVPPETPPALRKNKRRHLPAILGLDKDDDDWVKKGMPPLDEVDPNKPWVKDTRGRHHNLLAILDWPDEEESDDDNTSASQAQSSTNGAGICVRKGCTKSRARNPRTAEYHDYCSLRCQHMDNENGGSPNAQTNRQYNVDLMIALQMSRLQLLQDLKVLSNDDDDDDDSDEPSSSVRSRRLASANEHPFLAEDVDPDLQLAIERSVSDVNKLTRTCQDDTEGQCSSSVIQTDTSAVHLFLKRMAEKETDKTYDGNLLNESDITLKFADEKKVDKVLIKSATQQPHITNEQNDKENQQKTDDSEPNDQ